MDLHEQLKLDMKLFCNCFYNFVKICNCFLKILIFFPFVSLTTISSQQNFLSLADDLHDRTSETKMVLNFFSANMKLFFS